jgi:hypothetical protein
VEFFVTVSTRTDAPNLAKDRARFMAAYAKNYAAGAFGSPTAKDLETATPTDLVEWSGPDGDRTLAYGRRLTRPSQRRDFIGRTYTLPTGTLVCDHIARTPGAQVPDLGRYDVVYAYPEDTELAEGLVAQGREQSAVTISASSEIIAAWGRPGTRFRYSPVDLATFVKVPFLLREQSWKMALADVVALDSGLWDDDYPFYSDGTWAGVSLRGFDRDPRWGVKPAEMPSKWQREHPGALERKCTWTTLAERTPGLVGLVEDAMPPGVTLERVRLMRMKARPKGGKLRRHSDITDRSAGTRNGQIARFHLPLVTHPDVKMTLWELDGSSHAEHLEPGRLYYLDQRKPHAVANPSPVDRIHLVIDAVCDPAVRGMIAP